MPITCLQGLYYDAESERLYVLSGATNTLWELTMDGQIVHGWAFPCSSQEGITVDDHDNVYLAQDSGGVVKLKWMR